MSEHTWMSFQEIKDKIKARHHPQLRLGKLLTKTHALIRIHAVESTISELDDEGHITNQATTLWRIPASAFLVEHLLP